MARLASRRPELPWIPYPAIDALAARIRSDWHVLEIGSGMSTIWLARHAATVTSYEADRGWFEFLQQRFAAMGVTNVERQHRWIATEMCDFSQFPDRSLDLAFVDGGPRLDCVQAALPKLKPGGLLYVDNVDDSARPDSTKRFLIARAPLADLVNVGLTGLQSETLDWERLEHWSAELIARERTSYYLEQALVAMLVANRPCAIAPAADYVTKPEGDEACTCRAVMHHYVADSKRWYFQQNWRTALG